MNKKYTKILTKNKLYKEYILNKKSLYSVALLFGCHRNTIWKYLIKYNISRRKKEETYRLNLKYHKDTCNCVTCKAKRKENKGKMAANYIDGRTPIWWRIRNLEEYDKWRIQVFERDNYTCQECGKINCYVEVHHIKAFAKILQEFLQFYNQFSPIEDKETLIKLAMKHKSFWDIDNGKTLCKECHKLTKNFRKKIKYNKTLKE